MFNKQCNCGLRYTFVHPCNFLTCFEKTFTDFLHIDKRKNVPCICRKIIPTIDEDVSSFFMMQRAHRSEQRAMNEWILHNVQQSLIIAHTNMEFSLHHKTHYICLPCLRGSPALTLSNYTCRVLRNEDPSSSIVGIIFLHKYSIFSLLFISGKSVKAFSKNVKILHDGQTCIVICNFLIF